MHSTRGRVRTQITAVLLAVCAACAACSGPASPQAQAGADQSAVDGVAAGSPTSPTAATPSARPSATATQAPTATPAQTPAAGEPTSKAPVARPADPKAPARIVPVVREGAKASGVLSAAARPATAAVTYADGVSARITALSTSAVQGRGPGVMAGAPITLATIEVRNGSRAPLDLTRVVVTGRYGSPARLAAVTYVPQSLDFSGPLAPGASASAVYAVTFPSGLRRGDALVVDLDAGHAPAVFLGPSA